jgi:hypothetical protein
MQAPRCNKKIAAMQCKLEKKGKSEGMMRRVISDACLERNGKRAVQRKGKAPCSLAVPDGMESISDPLASERGSMRRHELVWASAAATSFHIIVDHFHLLLVSVSLRRLPGSSSPPSSTHLTSIAGKSRAKAPTTLSRKKVK